MKILKAEFVKGVIGFWFLNKKYRLISGTKKKSILLAQLQVSSPKTKF